MKTTTLTVSAMFGLCAMGASAGHFNAASLTNGASSAHLDLGDAILDIQTVSGNFKSKTIAGYTMMGISGGHVSGEIDATESMHFTFDRAVRITSLELGALFINGQHGDQVNERAFVTINDSQTFELALTSATSASWDGLGNVTALSQGLQGDAGYFQIAGEDIFGTDVYSMTLWAPQENVSGSRGSDYGFGALTTAPAVPAPGAFALMGLGGLLSARRLRS